MTAIEAALGALSPARSRLDRDRLMFRAGQAQAASRPSAPARWAWPALAASLAVVALGEAALLAVRPEPEPRVVERLVVVREPAPSEPAEPSAPAMSSVLDEPAPVVILHQSPQGQRRVPTVEPSWPASQSAQLRRQVLRFGIDTLPEPPPLALHAPDEGPTPSGRMLRSEIERFLNPRESS